MEPATRTLKVGERPVSLFRGPAAYALSRWEALGVFMDDGRVEIDNNIAERAMRPIGIGRKNWLFAGSDKGGERIANMLTLIETAKMNGHNPETYPRGRSKAPREGGHEEDKGNEGVYPGCA